MRRGAGTCPPPSGKSSVSSSTTWKPLNTSFLPLLPSVCSSAGLQETTVVVNCARGIENKPDPSPQATGTESPSAPCSTRRPPPAPPHAPSPSQPYVPRGRSCPADTGMPSPPSPGTREVAHTGTPAGRRRAAWDNLHCGRVSSAQNQEGKGRGVAWTNLLQTRFEICDLQEFWGAYQRCEDFGKD